MPLHLRLVRPAALAGPVLASVALCATVLLGLSGPAAASCADDGFAPEGSPVVFSGIVVEDRGAYTRLAVDKVWEGPDLAGEVWVQGGQGQAWWPLNLFQQVESSVDAEFEVGEQYVVGASDDFTTSACSVAAVDERPAPEDAREPVGNGDAGADVPMSPVRQTVLAAGALAVLVTVVVARRRRG